MNEEILKLNNQLCFRLYAVSRKMTQLYKPLLEKFNLTYPQYIIMLVLFEHEEIDFKKLSDIVDLKTGTISPIIDKLEKKKLIKKNTNKEDARKLNISITKEGLRLKEVVIEVPIKLASNLEISEDMYKVLVKELDDLSSILKKAKIIQDNK